MLALSIALPIGIKADEIPVVIYDGISTLTFTYADASQVGENENDGSVIYRLEDYALTDDEDNVINRGGNITKVVFTSAFAKARPKTTKNWFYGMYELDSIEGIGNLNTTEVTDMSSMFGACSNLTNLDVSNFNTTNVTNMSNLFFNCSSLTSLDVSKFNTANVTDMSSMFVGCSGVTSLDVSKFNTANVTTMADMFQECSALTSLDVSKFNTDKVTDMSGMFYGCNKLTSLDVSKFNTDKVTDMAAMFDGCNLLTSLDVSNFNTANVTYLDYMFRNCYMLTSLDVSKFNTEKVTDMSYMFYSCLRLTNIDVSKFNTANVTDMKFMFYQCNDITSLDLSNFVFPQNHYYAGYDLLYGCGKLKELNMGSNSLNDVDAQEAFSRVGTDDDPCYLIINNDFDKSVLGESQTNDSGVTYYVWLYGRFRLDKRTDDIEGVLSDEQANSPAGTYDLNGRKLQQMQRGVNIVRFEDGTVKKILMK